MVELRALSAIQGRVAQVSEEEAVVKGGWAKTRPQLQQQETRGTPFGDTQECFLLYWSVIY